MAELRNARARRRRAAESWRQEEFPAFPFEPYEIQRHLMRAVYEILSAGGAGIVESPTGEHSFIAVLHPPLAFHRLLRRRSEEMLDLVGFAVAISCGGSV